jgi:RHS repeat-associated protein
MLAADKTESLAALPSLSGNSRLRFAPSTNELHPAFAFANSNTGTGLQGCLYDFGGRSRSTGKERDAETGLDYFEARYYSGAQGRFTSPDEFKGGFDNYDGTSVFQPGPLPYADIGDPQTLNKYVYVRNNPLRYTDPNGHCFWDACVVEGYATYVAAGAIAAGAVYLSTPQGQQALRSTATAVANGIGSLVSWATGSDSPQQAQNPAAPGGVQTGQGQNATTPPTGAQPGSTPAAGTATNTNPYAGPVSGPVTVVDPKGNAIPVNTGQQIQGSKDGSYVQVKDENGNATGVRIDAGHKPSTHTDPRAQQPHAHVPGKTNPDGTPWLPINQ